MIELLNMDCMEYLAGLPDKAFDLAVCDPPYGIGVMRKERKPETERQALYVRGILRNRLSYINHAECLRLIKGAVESGYSIESITDFAKIVKTWTAFRDELEGLQNG